ncbi:Rieske (2Fe-2S) protein [bacterium AH-315-E10]|nr:Rieske (2Fe-2S) protein [bacterium AH-315-E10]
MARTQAEKELVKVDTLKNLKEKGVKVVKAGGPPIAVFYHEDKVSAVDNRCPHMGFPLHKGSVNDGILTCHWHHAHFDLCSGCAFDLFAGDIPVYDAEIIDDVVYVSAVPRREQDKDYHLSRLQIGLAQNIGVVRAKAIASLVYDFAAVDAIFESITDYALQHLQTVGDDIVTLTIARNLQSYMSQGSIYHFLALTAQRISSNAQQSVPFQYTDALETSEHDFQILKRWFRHWILSRSGQAAERVLTTAVSNEMNTVELNELVFSALTDRVFANTGHLLDAANKVFELLPLLKNKQKSALFPLLVNSSAAGRGSEESANFHGPVELIQPMEDAYAQLEKWTSANIKADWQCPADLQEILFGDDPLLIIDVLKNALLDGADPLVLSKAVTFNAAERLARFAYNNDVRDWFAPQHSYNFSNAVHQMLKRSQSPELLRGIFHAAIATYQDRFLNKPPAKLPSELAAPVSLPDDADALLQQLLDDLNQKIDQRSAANIVSHYIHQGHDLKALIDTLCYAITREDVDFHYIQVLEDSVMQLDEWNGVKEREILFIAVIRNLSAASPTRRGNYQNATNALQLAQGKVMHED